MQNTLVVVADLGGFKAFKLGSTAVQRTPRLELLEQYQIPDAHSHLVEKVSDQSGRFPRGSKNGQMSDGERHNIDLELRKRFIRQLANRLNTLAGSAEIDRCFLAVSREINNQLVGELHPQVRAKIQKNVPADLTKLEHTAILNHF